MLNPTRTQCTFVPYPCTQEPYYHTLFAILWYQHLGSCPLIVVNLSIMCVMVRSWCAMKECSNRIFVSNVEEGKQKTKNSNYMGKQLVTIFTIFINFVMLTHWQSSTRRFSHVWLQTSYEKQKFIKKKKNYVMTTCLNYVQKHGEVLDFFSIFGFFFNQKGMFDIILIFFIVFFKW